MSKTIKDLDFSPARGKSLGSCSISCVTLFLVDKQRRPWPLGSDRGERHFLTCGPSYSPRQPTCSLDSCCSRSLPAEFCTMGSMDRPLGQPSGLGPPPTPQLEKDGTNTHPKAGSTPCQGLLSIKASLTQNFPHLEAP